MALPLIPGVPPQALPVAFIGWLAVRNLGRKRNSARISGRSTRSRRSSTQGQDGEEVILPGSRRNKKGSRTILRR